MPGFANNHNLSFVVEQFLAFKSTHLHKRRPSTLNYGSDRKIQRQREVLERNIIAPSLNFLEVACAQAP